MDQNYERGWQKYSFDSIVMREAKAHGSDVTIRAGGAINRGPGELNMSMVEVPSHTGGDAIGLHIHRDHETGHDVEELYIVIEGVGQMTFSNGDVVTLSAGDVVTTYPGTGHAFRTLGDVPVRLIAVVPHGFRTARRAVETDSFPERFAPTIQVLTCDPIALSPLEARCIRCGGGWAGDRSDDVANELPVWATGHACVSSS